MTGEVLRRLVAVLGLDLDQKDFDKAEIAIRKVTATAKTLAGALAGGLIAKGFKDVVLGAVEAADKVSKTAEKIGLSTTALQELSHAANLSGLNSEELSTGLRFLSRNASEAAMGSKEAQESFAALGVGFTDANGKVLPTEELLTRVADRMATVTNTADRTNLAMRLFGRSGAGMINMLKDGGAGLAAMRAEVAELGGAFDDDFIRRSVEINDNITRLQLAFTGVRNAIVAEVLPALSSLLEWTLRGWKTARKFFDGTNAIRLGLISMAAAAGLAAFSLSAKLLTALGGVAQMSAAAVIGVKGLGNATLAAQAKGLLFGAAFVALAAAIFFVWEEVLTALNGGETLFGNLATKVSELYDQFVAFSQGKWFEPLFAPIRELIADLGQVRDLIFATVMAVKDGDFSGFKLFEERGKDIEKRRKKLGDENGDPLYFLARAVVDSPGKIKADKVKDPLTGAFNAVVDWAKKEFTVAKSVVTGRTDLGADQVRKMARTDPFTAARLAEGLPKRVQPDATGDLPLVGIDPNQETPEPELIGLEFARELRALRQEPEAQLTAIPRYEPSIAPVVVPFSQPAMTSSQAPTPLVSSPSITLQQTINAAPGQDAEAVGAAAGRSAVEVLRSEIENAKAVLLPLAAGGN